MTLAARLQAHGLFLRGVVRFDAREIDRYGFPDDKPCCALVGNVGSSYWKDFSGSAEYRDGLDDPLDRWSRRIAGTLAAEFALQPVYPFEGPPYYPFQQWARRAEGLAQSPLGIMMHVEHGLWHSYRFGLLGTDFDVAAVSNPLESPCLTCTDRPCLRACPVDAFDGAEYDVESCAAFLRGTPDADCHRRGCLARNACPVAPGLRYVPEQSAFHLRAFLAARE
jgi:hypothetical protein